MKTTLWYLNVELHFFYNIQTNKNENKHWLSYCFILIPLNIIYISSDHFLHCPTIDSLFLIHYFFESEKKRNSSKKWAWDLIYIHEWICFFLRRCVRNLYFWLAFKSQRWQSILFSNFYYLYLRETVNCIGMTRHH